MFSWLCELWVKREEHYLAKDIMEIVYFQPKIYYHHQNI